MEDLLKQELDTTTLKVSGKSGSGAICQGVGYQTDHGMVFVKTNNQPWARSMFEGEFYSLQSLYNTGEVRVPKPIKVLDNPEGGAMLVIEYFDLTPLSSYTAMLGQQVAKTSFGEIKQYLLGDNATIKYHHGALPSIMTPSFAMMSQSNDITELTVAGTPFVLHNKNSEIGKQMKKNENSVHRDPNLVYVDKFGFDVVTYCGYIPQCNERTDNWVQFFARKMEEQMNELESKYGDRKARCLWSQLLPHLPVFFTGLDIEPALLHGDLWSGNAGQLTDGPVIYDPACFYGHAEFDLSMSLLFRGIESSFYDSYHKIKPKEPGFKARLRLYYLFHNINHWNHFGGEYKTASMKLLQQLVLENPK